MKVLLDECIPKRLRTHLNPHECITVPDAGMSGLKNGALLKRAEELGFELFLTMDKGIAYQQNLAGRSIAVLILRTHSNQLSHLLPYVPDCLAVMERIDQGEVMRVGLTR